MKAVSLPMIQIPPIYRRRLHKSSGLQQNKYILALGPYTARLTLYQDKAPSNKQQASGEASGVRRLKRLRKLRPDLASKLKNVHSINKSEAVRVGGYSSPDTMHRDLDARDAALQKKGKKNEQKT